jgi:hypothetical protein
MNNILEHPSLGITINSEILKLSANEFKFLLENKKDLLDSFIQWWRERHNVKKYIISGNSSSSDFKSHNEWKLTILPPLLKKYGLRDIFNIDETGLSFKFFIYLFLINFTLSFIRVFFFFLIRR